MTPSDELIALARRLDAAYRPGLYARVNESVAREMPLMPDDAAALEARIQSYEQLKAHLGERTAAFEIEYARLAYTAGHTQGAAIAALVAMGFQVPAEGSVPTRPSERSSAVAVISLIEDLADSPVTPVRVLFNERPYRILRAELHKGTVVLLPSPADDQAAAN